MAQGTGVPNSSRMVSEALQTKAMVVIGILQLVLVAKINVGLAAKPGLLEDGPTVNVFYGTANIPAKAGIINAWPPAPPYDHTVKELGNTSDAAACQDACIAYRNAKVSPVSGWTHRLTSPCSWRILKVSWCF